MSALDARLWQVLHRVLPVPALGVLGLLLGLDPRPGRSASLYGLMIVLIVVLPVGAAVWRLPAHARRSLRMLPRYRPLMALTAGLLACATVLVGWWALVNALFPGTLSPLALALGAVALAGLTALVNRVLPRR